MTPEQYAILRDAALAAESEPTGLVVLLLGLALIIVPLAWIGNELWELWRSR